MDKSKKQNKSYAGIAKEAFGVDISPYEKAFKIIKPNAKAVKDIVSGIRTLKSINYI